MDQATQTEPARYCHAAMSIPTNTRLLDFTKQVFLKSQPDLSGSLIKKVLDKSINTTLVHIHMKRQEVQSTRKKASDIDISENINTNLVFFVKLDPSDSNKGKIYSDICGRFPIMSNKGNR